MQILLATFYHFAIFQEGVHHCQLQYRDTVVMALLLFYTSASRVTKSENFPDSKIFVAKTFQIKRVNRVNFQIRDKCALKVVLQDFG